MDMSRVLKAQWLQLRGKVKEQWGKLTDDELDQIDGQYDQLVGKIQEKYEYSRSKAEREIEEFLNA